MRFAKLAYSASKDNARRSQTGHHTRTKRADPTLLRKADKAAAAPGSAQKTRRQDVKDACDAAVKRECSLRYAAPANCSEKFGSEWQVWGNPLVSACTFNNGYQAPQELDTAARPAAMGLDSAVAYSASLEHLMEYNPLFAPDNNSDTDTEADSEDCNEDAAADLEAQVLIADTLPSHSTFVSLLRRQSIFDIPRAASRAKVPVGDVTADASEERARSAPEPATSPFNIPSVLLVESEASSADETSASEAEEEELSCGSGVRANSLGYSCNISSTSLLPSLTEIYGEPWRMRHMMQRPYVPVWELPEDHPDCPFGDNLIFSNDTLDLGLPTPGPDAQAGNNVWKGAEHVTNERTPALCDTWSSWTARCGAVAQEDQPLLLMAAKAMRVHVMMAIHKLRLSPLLVR